ncbi:hypothetical protein ERJ75_000373200 [Trypanosoma vivax]|nr:hypothetical protein ERJ75_000373200 [Trypanosoma vivax]
MEANCIPVRRAYDKGRLCDKKHIRATARELGAYQCFSERVAVLPVQPRGAVNSNDNFKMAELHVVKVGCRITDTKELRWSRVVGSHRPLTLLKTDCPPPFGVRVFSGAPLLRTFVFYWETEL